MSTSSKTLRRYFQNPQLWDKNKSKKVGNNTLQLFDKNQETNVNLGKDGKTVPLTCYKKEGGYASRAFLGTWFYLDDLERVWVHAGMQKVGSGTPRMILAFLAAGDSASSWTETLSLSKGLLYYSPVYTLAS